MKERPILFSGPMVKAILSGNKTQTRRTIKFNPPFNHASAWPFVNKFPDGWWVWTDFNPTEKDLAILRQNGNGRPCPFGQPGDRLWVREAWRNSTDRDGYACINYRADDKALSALAGNGGDGDWVKLGGEVEPMWKGRKEYDEQPWRPSIHMPRWASRITLEITGVKVERLQDISEEDAEKEGLIESEIGRCASKALETYKGLRCAPLVLQFAELWKSINGPGSWDANPWVWVVEFKEVKP